ncbi:MAG: aldo/keto reductase [Thaumarchaeota archaeon]|nr:aldo/keto reductase [Nitrososphaerota archaeon]MCY3975561.1 aldo/keto reductase [Nitrososphaerota archaeon]
MINGNVTADGTYNYLKKFSHTNTHNFNQCYGLNLSNLGMGTYLGDTTSDTDRLVKMAIKRSVSSGINIIDTAINYRSQKAERVVRKAILELIENNIINRDELFISTKNGYLTNDAEIKEEFWTYVEREYTQKGILRSGDVSASYHCMNIPFLEDQLTRSLKNLGLDCVDLMYIHNPWESHFKETSKQKFFQNLESIFAFYEEKIDKNKIKFYGMATWDCFRVAENNPVYLSLAEVLELAKNVGGSNHGFKFLQLPFNLYLDQAYLNKNQLVNNHHVSILEAAHIHNIGVFSSVPLMQGKLLDCEFIPELKLSNSAKLLQLVRSTPGILAPLVGHKLPNHVNENLEVLKTNPLSHEKFIEIVQNLLNNN